MLDLKAVHKRIGYIFKDWELLYTAFTHSSYANEKFVGSYERFEFLGDSILNFVVAEYLFKRYPKSDEGFLSKARAQIVSKKSLCLAVDRMKVIEFLRTSSGSIGDNIKASNSVRADLFEAILGAIYLDGGIKPAFKFVLKYLVESLEQDYTEDSITDYKSRLLESAAKSDKKVSFCFEPKKRETDNFRVTVLIDGEAMGKGIGVSKKKAEQLAAKEVLRVFELE